MFVIRTFNIHGECLAELQNAYNLSASWLLNKSGQLTFDLPSNDSKVSEANLHMGNNVAVYFDNFPTWTGYITNRDWGQDVVSVTAQSTLQRLGQRRTGSIKLTNQTATEVFKFLITEANSKQHTGIFVSTTYEGGKTYSYDYQGDNIYDKVGTLLDDSKLEISLTMEQMGVWLLSLEEKIGADLTGSIHVRQEIDMVGAADFQEDNTAFANSIIALGKSPSSSNSNNNSSGDDWGGRPKGQFIDIASVSEDGLAEDVVDYSDITDVATLATLAEQQVQIRKYPKRTITFNLNTLRGLWGTFFLGDKITVICPFYSFGGLVIPVRVTGLQVTIDTSTEDLAVTADVINGIDAISLDYYKAFQWNNAAGNVVYGGS